MKINQLKFLKYLNSYKYFMIKEYVFLSVLHRLINNCVRMY